jgi:hypothetical protein
VSAHIRILVPVPRSDTLHVIQKINYLWSQLVWTDTKNSINGVRCLGALTQKSDLKNKNKKQQSPGLDPSGLDPDPTRTLPPPHPNPHRRHQIHAHATVLVSPSSRRRPPCWSHPHHRDGATATGSARLELWPYMSMLVGVSWNPRQASRGVGSGGSTSYGVVETSGLPRRLAISFHCCAFYLVTPRVTENLN